MTETRAVEETNDESARTAAELSQVARLTRRRRRQQIGAQLGIFAVLFVIYFGFVFASPGLVFLSASSIKDIFLAATEMIILTVGETYVLIAGEIDLSIGSTVALTSVVTAKVMMNLSTSLGVGWSVVAGLVAGVGLGGLMGLLNGVITTRAKIPSFLVTLGTLSIGLGIAELMTGGQDIAGVPLSLQTDFGNGAVAGIPDIVVLALAVFLVAVAVLHWTRFGRRTYAIGSNSEAAKRAGVPVRRHVVLIFVVMGMLAELTGFVEVSRFGSTDIGGHATDALTAIAAAAIGGISIYGGRGRMWPTLGGVLIPTTIETGLIVMGVVPFWEVVAVGCLIIIAVGVDGRRRSASMRTSQSARPEWPEMPPRGGGGGGRPPRRRVAHRRCPSRASRFLISANFSPARGPWSGSGSATGA